MQAIRVQEFGPPEVMQVEEVDTPKATGSQVLVKVHAVGVNPVETYIRSGAYANAPKLPYTPGKDAAGVVEAVGGAATKWKAGDRVYTADSLTGTYAEYTLCDQATIGRLPDSVSFEKGAGIWTPYATAYRALFQKAGVHSNETILVHGASGGVGIAAIQWARGSDIKVIGTASSDEGKKLVLAQGAVRVFDHTDDGHLAEIRQYTGGLGVDVIVEMLANANLERDFEALGMFGRIVVVGSRGSLNFTPRLAMSKDATIYAMSLFNSSEADREDIHEGIHEGLMTNSLRPIIAKSFSLFDAAKAHHAVIEDKSLGKIVLIP